jgi:hypothetical protein
VNALVEGLDDDTVSDQLRFLNIHYFAAGATRFGTEAKGAYEYDGQTYVGFYDHVRSARQCVQCHSLGQTRDKDSHSLTVQVESCLECHEGIEETVEGLRAIRDEEDETDYDSDGNNTEGLAEEIETLRVALYQAIQEYAADVAGTPVVYDARAYPYYFNDANANGEADPDEERYNTWTPRLLKAAYNYQYATKDPGGFAHNGRYILQTLYDSLADLGTQVDVDMAEMVRP